MYSAISSDNRHKKLRLCRSFSQSGLQMDSITQSEVIKSSNISSILEIDDTNFEDTNNREFVFDRSDKLSILPDEILLIILKNLDLNSLIKLGTVNNRFNELTQDPSLYNTFNVCMRHDETSSIDNAEIENRVLSHFPFSKNLYLTYSPFVDDVLVKKISQCSRLRHLSLLGCLNVTDLGLKSLETLTSLEGLAVHFQDMKTSTLCDVLRRNKNLRKLYIDDHEETTNRVFNLDMIFECIGEHCQHLQYLTCPGSLSTLTYCGITALSQCTKLLTVHFRGCYHNVGSANLFLRCALFQSMEYRTVICMNESDLHPYLVNDEISGVLLHASEVPKLQMPNTLVGYSACTETKGVIICSVKKMNPVSGSDEIYSIQNYDQLPLFEMLTKRYDNWR